LSFVKLTFSSLKITFFIEKVTFSGLKVTFSWQKVTFSELKVTFSEKARHQPIAKGKVTVSDRKVTDKKSAIRHTSAS